MASRASNEFDDLRAQVFTNVAVYKVCEGIGCTMSRLSPLVRYQRCSFDLTWELEFAYTEQCFLV